jgi:hypothetical protein
LLIITPTRRLSSAQRLIDAVAMTATEDTDLILAVDDDDPAPYESDLGGRFKLLRGPRMTCPQWSNKLAVERGAGYFALASLGDDHIPETPGWDALLLDAIGRTGGTGIAYGDDTLQHQALPTAPVITTDIVKAVGWFFLPAARHYFCDNVWKDLGEAADCLAYVPGVIIRHTHYSFGTAPADAVYLEKQSSWGADEAAWRTWQRDNMASDAEKIRRLRRPT